MEIPADFDFFAVQYDAWKVFLPVSLRGPESTIGQCLKARWETPTGLLIFRTHGSDLTWYYI